MSKGTRKRMGWGAAVEQQEKERRIEAAERRVIEAAEAWDNYGGIGIAVCDELALAVDALREARKA